MPSSPEAFGFSSEDLEPLGTFFVNDLPFRVIDSPDAFRILPPKNALLFNGVTCLVIAAFFVGAGVWVAKVVSPDQRSAGLGGVVAIGTITVVGGFALGTARQQHLDRRGPVIDYDKAAGRLTIVGRRTFDRRDIVGLLCCSFYQTTGEGSARLDELAVVARIDGRQRRFLLMTLNSGSIHAFDYIAEPFAAATGLPAYRVWNEGVFGRGVLVAERVGPGDADPKVLSV